MIEEWVRADFGVTLATAGEVLLVRALQDVLDVVDRGELSYPDGLHSPAGLVTVAEGSLRRVL